MKRIFTFWRWQKSQLQLNKWISISLDGLKAGSTSLYLTHRPIQSSFGASIWMIERLAAKSSNISGAEVVIYPVKKKFFLNVGLKPVFWKLIWSGSGRYQRNGRLPQYSEYASANAHYSNLLNKIFRMQICELLVSRSASSAAQPTLTVVKSCLINLFVSLSWVKQSLEGRHSVRVCYMDLSKALHSVSFDHSVRKMKAPVTKLRANTWAENSLRRSTLSVWVGWCTTLPADTPRGIPQGALLVSTLFLSFFSGLANIRCKRLYLVADCIKIAGVDQHEDNREIRVRSPDWSTSFYLAKYLSLTSEIELTGDKMDGIIDHSQAKGSGVTGTSKHW